MKKKLYLIILTFILAIASLIGGVSASADENMMYLGGMPAGFSLQTRGACVVGVSDVITDHGVKSPEKDAGIEVGDVIYKINGLDINNAKDIENTVNDNVSYILEIDRNCERITLNVVPAKDLSGKYRLGVFIRDCVSGIGTITYITDDYYASLGHPILGDNGNVLSVLGGNIYSCNVTGVVKGEKGKAGELRGVFLREKPIASIVKNVISGVYGKISGKVDYSNLIAIEIGEAKIGNAKIYTTISGNKPKEYDINIVKCDQNCECKNFVIKITDQELLDQTGGIVQGMSGSPIVQNGKLVGAVTHVFLNDPTRGYGISIDNMLKNQ